jgi:alkanesulfonate monooxygenase SsuD/methylene tetrahydromethanopterin reductase-like flavin-dependent oxidoreductase (luciferase family)
MRVGVLILPEHRWAVAAEQWRHAEEWGFDHAWTYDHLAWRTLRDGPWFAAVPTLTAAAQVTTRIRLGTMVASPNFRHPVPFARELTTLDDISGGRLTAGVGSGGQGWDATILGQAPWTMAERTERFAEFVELLDALLRQPTTTFAGRYWSADDAPMHPGCVQQPRLPLAVAATAPKGMRVVARFGDVWVTNGDRAHEGPPLPPEEGAEVVRRQSELLERVCEAEGRDPASIDRLVLTGARLDDGLSSPDDFRRSSEAYAAVGVTDLVVHWPRPTDPYAGDPAVLEHLLT